MQMKFDLPELLVPLNDPAHSSPLQYDNLIGGGSTLQCSWVDKPAIGASPVKFNGGRAIAH
jgi:hypothetical protein